MNEEQVREIVREEILTMLGDYSNVSLEVINALSALGFVTASNLPSGLLYVSNGKINSLQGTGVIYLTSSVPSVVTGGSKGVYVATISGGSPNNFMQVANGIVTSI